MKKRPSAPSSSDASYESARVFAAVVEAKSFTAAARRLDLPKSAVSRRVSELEDALGVRLLQRTTRSLHLTEAGVAYYERIRRVLEAFGDANDAARALQGDPSGVIRITAPADFATRVLPALFARFLVDYPEVRMDLVLTNRRVDMVAEGFDIAFRFGKLQDSSLVARKLDIGGLTIVASPSYLAQHGTPRRVTDLAHHEVIVFRPASESWTLQGPHGRETIRVAGRLAADDLNFVREAALHGLGLTLAPAFLVAGDVERKTLAHVLPKFSVPGGEFHIVYPSARLLPRRLSLLIDFLLAELGPAITARVR